MPSPVPNQCDRPIAEVISDDTPLFADDPAYLAMVAEFGPPSEVLGVPISAGKAMTVLCNLGAFANSCRAEWKAVEDYQLMMSAVLQIVATTALEANQRDAQIYAARRDLARALELPLTADIAAAVDRALGFPPIDPTLGIVRSAATLRSMGVEIAHNGRL